MQYLILNRKMHLLETINIMNRTKGLLFKQKFKYEKILLEQNEMKRCLSIYIELQIILKLLTENHKSIAIQNELMAHVEYINREDDLFNDQFAKYKSDIMKSLSFVKNYNKQFNENDLRNTNTANPQINKDDSQINEDELQSMIQFAIICINDLIDQLIKKNDPHIECEYFITVQNCKSVEPMGSVLLAQCGSTTPIIPNGICSSLYLDCHEQINLSTENELLDESYLRSITEKDFKELFEIKKINSNSNHFIDLWVRESQFKYLRINFIIDEKVLTGGSTIKTTTIKIIDLPQNSRMRTSIINNEMRIVNCKSSDNYRNHTIILKDYWLTACINNLDQISLEDYNMIHSDLKKRYTYKKTNTNKFVVDYVFNELVSHNVRLVTPNMLKSFRDLARDTSIHHQSYPQIQSCSQIT